MIALVTGATGFVGSHVVRKLIEQGDRVRALVRPTSEALALKGLPVEQVAGDLRVPSSLDAALRGVQVVYHVAADYRLWARNPREIYENNVAGTRNLLQAATRARVDRVVYTSTVGTVAVPRPALPDEETQADLSEMIGHYKKSKFLAEREAFSAAAAGLPVVVVNPTTPVGPGDWKPTPTGGMILSFLRKQMPAYLDTGLNLVPVEDVAAGHLLAAERGKVGRRYILGGRNMRFKEILDILAAITGRRSPSLRLPHFVALAAGYADWAVSGLLNREPRIPLEGVRMARHSMFVDCSRAKRELGFCSGSVQGALERAVRWYEENHYLGAAGCEPVAPGAGVGVRP